MMAKVNVLREWWSSRASAILACIETQSTGGEELSPALLFRDGSQSALMPSVLDRVSKGEL
jgi:hypothetical protein